VEERTPDTAALRRRGEEKLAVLKREIPDRTHSELSPELLKQLNAIPIAKHEREEKTEGQQLSQAKAETTQRVVVRSGEKREKVRIFALARELNMESKDLLALCQKNGLDIRTQLSFIEPEQRDQILDLVKRSSD
jgi:hypothetical protein